MNFIIKETGEKREVTYLDKSGVDWARDIAINNGLFDDDSVKEDDDQDAIIAPRDVVEYWEEYFATLTTCDEELDELRNKYDGDEVDEIYYNELGCDYPDHDDVKAAVKATRAILQKRYNTETAILLGSYASDLPQSDFQYYKESLYRQDTGAFFLVGEGGAMTVYGRTFSNGSIGYGERSIGITYADAKAWAAKHPDNPFPAGCFEPVKS